MKSSSENPSFLQNTACVCITECHLYLKRTDTVHSKRNTHLVPIFFLAPREGCQKFTWSIFVSVQNSHLHNRPCEFLEFGLKCVFGIDCRFQPKAVCYQLVYMHLNEFFYHSTRVFNGLLVKEKFLSSQRHTLVCPNMYIKPFS